MLEFAAWMQQSTKKASRKLSGRYNRIICGQHCIHITSIRHIRSIKSSFTHRKVPIFILRVFLIYIIANRYIFIYIVGLSVKPSSSFSSVHLVLFASQPQAHINHAARPFRHNECKQSIPFLITLWIRSRNLCQNLTSSSSLPSMRWKIYAQESARDSNTVVSAHLRKDAKKTRRSSVDPKHSVLCLAVWNNNRPRRTEQAAARKCMHTGLGKSRFRSHIVLENRPRPRHTTTRAWAMKMRGVSVCQLC